MLPKEVKIVICYMCNDFLANNLDIWLIVVLSSFAFSASNKVI